MRTLVLHGPAKAGHYVVYHSRQMNDRFLRACKREPVDRTPVWFMRQAGRYMAEYRELRSRYSLLDSAAPPNWPPPLHSACSRIEVDAAILFSDLLLPLEPLGIPFDFVRGEGPAIENPLRTEADINRLTPFEPREGLAHVLETIRWSAPRSMDRTACRPLDSEARRLRSRRTPSKEATRKTSR